MRDVIYGWPLSHSAHKILFLKARCDRLSMRTMWFKTRFSCWVNCFTWEHIFYALIDLTQFFRFLDQLLTIFWYETKSRHSSLKKVFWNIVLLWFFPTGDVTRWSVRPRDLFSLVWSSTWTRRRRCPVASASSNSTSGVRVRYLNITNFKKIGIWSFKKNLFTDQVFFIIFFRPRAFSRN